MNATDMTLCELISALDRRIISAEEVARDCLARIRATEGLNNFITLLSEDALFAAAKKADKARAEGKAPPLCGVPVAVKDNIETAGMKTTCGSLALKNYIPAADAQVVKTLALSGAVVIGKTNMDEFAMGSTNESSAFGAVVSAIDPCRVPGGSSGGSANAVAAHQVPCALGTDTGGSVRQPASYCGVVGLKPTFGSVKRGGLLGMSPSLDQIGTLTVDCDDAALLFGIIAEKNLGALSGDARGKRIGISADIMSAYSEKGVMLAVERAEKTLTALGAELVSLPPMPSFKLALTAYHVISSAEAAETLRGYRSFADLGVLGDEAIRRAVIGSYVVTGKNYDELYLRAARVRSAVKSEFLAALEECDAVLLPTCPTTAAKLGAQTDPEKTHGLDAFAAPASLAGLPAVSVPFGRSEGLPVGVQLIGRANCERTVLDLGKALMSAGE